MSYVTIAFPSLAFSLLFYCEYGSPTNWWKPFFGIAMTVNKDKIIRREQSGEDSASIQLEINDWVAKMAKSRYYRINPYTYKFLRKGDAMMFKLTWG